MSLPDRDETARRFASRTATLRCSRRWWSFKGTAVTEELVMQRAGVNSDKPIDVLKIVPKDKGKPELATFCIGK